MRDINKFSSPLITINWTQLAYIESTRERKEKKDAVKIVVNTPNFPP